MVDLWLHLGNRKQCVPIKPSTQTNKTELRVTMAVDRRLVCILRIYFMKHTANRFLWRLQNAWKKTNSQTHIKYDDFFPSNNVRRNYEIIPHTRFRYIEQMDLLEYNKWLCYENDDINNDWLAIVTVHCFQDILVSTYWSSSILHST